MKERFPGEFDDLAEKVIDAVANDEERQRFTAFLRDDEALRYRYAELMRVHALLISRGSRSGVCQTCQTGQAVRTGLSGASATGFRRRRFAAAALAAALVIGLTAWLALEARLRPSASGARESAQSSEAHKAIYACEYAQILCRHDDGGLELPARLPGTVRLPHGRVKLRLSSGIELTLLGPLELRMENPMTGHLSHGKLLAYMEPGSSGFMLRTPDLQMWDIGTVFGVTVDELGSDVFVFKGAVQVLEACGEPVDLCNVGEGVRARRDGSGAVKFTADWPEAEHLLADTLGRCVRRNVEVSLETAGRISDMWAERYMPKVAQRRLSAADYLKATERRVSLFKSGLTAKRKDKEMKSNGMTKAALAAAVIGATALKTSG
ncbi:MAG: hypothetical protein PHU80_05560, partial [Kiritimatiellae bacterium]|nr:hypothetical protein [Kiritimatiellia bacterium]